jgi:hypothetical protein
LRRRVWVDHKLYYTSRLIWKYVYGVDPQAQVDHFDRDTTNEKLDNLRDITHGHQALNKARQRNTTGAKGIGFRPGTRRRVPAGRRLIAVNISGTSRPKPPQRSPAP